MPEHRRSEDVGWESSSVEDSEATLLSWPRKGDRLVISSLEDWRNNARPNFFGHGVVGLGERASGFRDAAEELALHTTDQTYTLDTRIHPIGMLYRHYLELAMKELIARGRRLVQGKHSYPKTHNLCALWRESRKHLSERFDSLSQETLDAVEEVIVQMALIDPDAQAFRYTVTKEGTPTLRDVPLINIRNLKEAMKRISNFFDGANEYFCVLVQTDNDMQEELRFLV